MNKVILMGRLTRDPDVRYGQGEKATPFARYTLAVDRRFVRQDGGDNQQTADFIGCVAFGRAAEFAEKYLRQGTKIVVTGRIQTGSYTNRDGQKVYTTDVVVEDQEFAESKAASQGSGNYNNGGSYQGGNSYNNQNSYGGQNSGAGSYGSQGASGYAQEQRREAPAPMPEGFMNIPDGVEDEGLPFN